MQNILSIAVYAKACGLTPQAIYKRRNKRALKMLIYKGAYFIDAAKYPPISAKPKGRKPLVYKEA